MSYKKIKIYKESYIERLGDEVLKKKLWVKGVLLTMVFEFTREDFTFNFNSLI